ncbi:MAG TPA: DUF885 domain-containing protein [bacterium]
MKSSLFSISIVLTLMLNSWADAQKVADTGDGDIEQLFTDFVRDYVALSPTTGTTLGLPASAGIPVRNDLLDDISQKGQDQEFALYKEYRARLDRHEEKDLTVSQRLACAQLKWYMDMRTAGDAYRYNRYLINPGFGFHNELTTLMTEHHKIKKFKDAEDYIARLKGYQTYIQQLLDHLAICEQKKAVPPVYIISNLEEILSEFISVLPIENILYTSFRDRLSEISAADARTKDRLKKEALKAIDNSVYPAYRNVISYLATLRPKADSLAGVWKLPQGNAYYQYCLNFHTTTGMAPAEIHELGLAEVARIEHELVKIYKELGIPGKNYQEMAIAFQKLILADTTGKFLYPATDVGKQQTLKGYQTIIDTMYAHLPDMFGTVPKAVVKVGRVPEFKEATAGTYYQPPRLDGTGGGIFYANLGYRHSKPGMKALTYHEAIPGHHLQIALEQGSADARLFKSLFFFTGYVEGWALYAERLALENGFYTDLYSRIGYLRSELFRAVRLVLDTGIHWKKWSRDQAAAYMQEHCLWSADGEIYRYIVWPGQACAYKTGELAIIRLRESARAALGRDFDIREFHDEILRYGSMPLDQLEELLEDYIDTKKGANY